ncbi:cardiolipin synthase [Shimia thalassica]|uniref:cardiolipin synthase n=1 Tax=Shimia thalassica TaxID=1715693 RepID=UPI00249473F9|nr:cardiolipin synthase [Shimia thalassica]
MVSLSLALLIVLEAVAIWFAWRAIASARTSQGAIGWVVFLITAPYLGVPLYLFLGHHKFKSYIKARKSSEEVIDGLRTYRETNAPAVPPEFPVGALEEISDLPVVRGNDMTLLTDGASTFEAIFSAIDNAQSYVLVQFYIVKDDDLGCALRDRMISAAKRGISVRFVCDPVGSVKLSQGYRDDLSAAGVEVVEPSKMRGPKNRFQLNFRNHRKTVIVDGATAFTGGFNVGDEYMGRDPKFGNWRDTHVMMSGPVVAQLQLIFAEDWHWATGETLIDPLNWQTEHAPADKSAMIVPTGPGDEMETGALFFFTAIANARKRIWIASPYFVPDVDVLTALKHAALQGVDVRILVPEVIDHKIPWLAAFAYFDEIREAGVQVLRYNDGFMHQKVLVVDDHMAAIGTTNMDIRSFRLNFETMAVFFDKQAAQSVSDMFEADFKKSFVLEKTLAEQPRHIRTGAPIARLFSPVL